MKQTDIAIFLPSLRGGGAERAMAHLAGGLAGKGHTVDLVLAFAEGPYLAEVDPSVRVMDLASRRVRDSFAPLVRYIGESRPRVILSTPNHMNITTILARKRAAAPSRLIVREAATLSQSLRHRPLHRRWIGLGLTRWLYPKTDGIVAVSRGVADDLARVLRLRRPAISVAYNPIISADVFRLAKEPINHPWFSGGGSPVVLAVGRMSKAKDFQTLIRAVALARRERDMRLVILGEGEERERLQRLVVELRLQEAVDMPGFVGNPFPYMDRAALFVLSSLHEGMPNALIQAMAMGTPVISTDCPSGPKEIFAGEEVDPFVPVSAPAALARRILVELRKAQDLPKQPKLVEIAMRFDTENSLRQYQRVCFPF